MGILFSAPQREFEFIRSEWYQDLEDIASKGVFVGGPFVSRLEASLKEYFGGSEVIGVGNGTDALFLSLKALGIGQGDEVITPTNTFIATVEAIVLTGATPVLVDCNEQDYLMNITQVKDAITEKTKAIIPVHLYGQTVDLEQILSICEGKDIHIIEDCAQAFGADYKKRKVGTIGTFGCFSFYPDKNLGALGDGGAIITENKDYAKVIRELANHGGTKRYVHDRVGLNSRLDPIQASALNLKLKYIDSWNDHRRSMAAYYNSSLQNIKGIQVYPQIGDDHVYHLFVIEVKNSLRTKLKKRLQRNGVLTGLHYPKPVHLTPAFEFLGYKNEHFPVSEKKSDRILSLPMHIALTKENIDCICEIIRNTLELPNE